MVVASSSEAACLNPFDEDDDDAEEEDEEEPAAVAAVAVERPKSSPVAVKREEVTAQTLVTSQPPLSVSVCLSACVSAAAAGFFQVLCVSLHGFR